MSHCIHTCVYVGGLSSTRVPVFIVLQRNLDQSMSCNDNTEVIMYYVDTTVNNNVNSANVIDNTTTTM